LKFGKGFFTFEALFSLVCLLGLLCAIQLPVVTHNQTILFLQASDFAEVCVEKKFVGMEESLNLIGLKAKVEKNGVVLLDQKPKNSVKIFREYVEDCVVVRASFEVGL